MSDQQAEPGLLTQMYASMLPEMDAESLRGHRREVESMVAAGDEHAASKAVVAGIVQGLRAKHDR